MALVLGLTNNRQIKFEINKDKFRTLLENKEAIFEIVIAEKDNEATEIVGLHDLFQILDELTFYLLVDLPNDLYNDQGEVVYRVKTVICAPQVINIECQPKSKHLPYLAHSSSSGR